MSERTENVDPRSEGTRSRGPVIVSVPQTMFDMAGVEIECLEGKGGVLQEDDRSEKDDAIIIPDLRRRGGKDAHHKAKPGKDPALNGKRTISESEDLLIAMGWVTQSQKSIRMRFSRTRLKPSPGNNIAMTVRENRSERNGGNLHCIGTSGLNERITFGASRRRAT